MSSRNGRKRAALGGLIASALILGGAAQSDQRGANTEQQRTKAAEQKGAAQPTQPGVGPVDASVMQGKSSNQRGEPAKDQPSDSVVIRVLRFFDRHNGSFNAFAAIAVAFFTWRLWRWRPAR